MSGESADWSYGKELGPERIDRLSGEDSFERIAAQILAAAQPGEITFAIDKGWMQPVTGCLRPRFAFRVGEAVGDLFFNGLSGYRAQYYRSSAAGEAANRLLLDGMLGLLLQAAERADFRCQAQHGEILMLTRSAVAESLKLPGAKIWPCEGRDTNPEFHEIVCAGDLELRAEISAPRWLALAERGVIKARRGVRAPRISFLDIKGSFINQAGEERIPEDKVMRSCEIAMMGFT